VTTIRRVLVANRGEIARRVFRTCRDLGISTVAVFSDPDADAPFTRDADFAVALGGSLAADSYLCGERIVAAAVRAEADAIHPGYGFLAENAEFARSVLAAGLIWIGPSPIVIEAMGSKIEARRRMAAAGVPVLTGVHVEHERGVALAALGAKIGYPLLVKASAGGGGKGIRLVEEPSELESSVDGARREAASAFSDDSVFLERYVRGARHIEIQILGDAHGNVATLHERDCSVQRRHQKVIEEAPSPALIPELRAQMSAAAAAAGRALDYVGAGTVEFLLDAESNFFFLEVNTRLQVEHPVTEMVTGLDLVELQLMVAEGLELPAAALAPGLRGHAVEARLYAEDPSNGFLPVAGTIARFRIDGPVRVDTGVADGTSISAFYDPMIAKVIAHGSTRGHALRRLADALARAEIHGITTNRDFLVRVLRHPEFVAGGADTSFLDRHDPAELGRALVDRAAEREAAAAAALAAQAGRRRTARALGSLPSGWRNNRSQLERVEYRTERGDPIVVEYGFGRDGSVTELRVDGVAMTGTRLHHCTETEVLIGFDGVTRRFRVWDSTVNTEQGQVTFAILPSLGEPPAREELGSLASPMPGTVIRVVTEHGAVVEAGQPLLVLEAMKMEHEVVAPVTGVIVDIVSEGTQVDTGVLLAVIDSDD
jgi:propionyl-CoA carboxylase alpha chain